jgi:hypothetical protein
LENTKTVVQAGCLKDTIDAYRLPQLIPRQYFTPEGWAELFLQALPKLRAITKRIVARKSWKANELSNLMLSEIKAPYLGVKTVRLAIRWLHELLPNFNIDMNSYEIPIDRLVYRVSCRLGLLDPNVDNYWGQGSDADVKLQSLVRQLLPGKQWIFDEPLWSTGRKAVNGGHCFPIKPNCSGCIFNNICQKKYLDFAPESMGMQQTKQSKRQFRFSNICEKKHKPSDQQLAFANFINELHQKGIKGDEFRDKRAQWLRERKDQGGI